MKNRKGFTLIEMMLTVAIVVVLSSVLTTNVTQFIAGADGAGTAVESQSNKYDTAQSEVKGLGGVTVAATTTLATTAVGATTTAAAGTTTTAAAVTTTTAAAVTTTTAPAVTTTTAPAVTTTTAAATTTAASGIPSSYSSNHSVSSQNTTSWNNGFNYRSTLSFPSSSKFQYLTVYIPAGATLTGDSRVKSISYSNANTAVIKIEKYQSSAIIDVKYTGSNYVMVITGVSS